MVAVNYLWNPLNDNIVREFDDSGTAVAEYTTEPDLYGNVVSQYRTGQTSYLHFDGQGNTSELTNDAGNVTDAIRYRAFGELEERTGSTDIRFQFVGLKGYWTDVDTHEYSIRRQILSAFEARWLSIEVSQSHSGLGGYVYVGNRPCMLNDPAGALRTALSPRLATDIVEPLEIISVARGEPDIPSLNDEAADDTCAPAKKRQCRYRIWRVKTVDPTIPCMFTASDVILDTIVCTKSCITGTTCPKTYEYRLLVGKPERLVCSANGKYVGCDEC